jgi:hypothetical protein
MVGNKMAEQRPDDGKVPSLDYSLTQVLLKSMEEAVGRRNGGLGVDKERLPKAIVTMMKQRKRLESAWKREKSGFASARSPTPPDSLVMAGRELQDMTDKLTEAISEFRRVKRGSLLKLVRSKSKKARKVFWSHVSRKEKSSVDITALQDQKTGVLYCGAEDIAVQAEDYLLDIFSGSLDPSATAAAVASTSATSSAATAAATAAVADPGLGQVQQVGGDHGYGVDLRPTLLVEEGRRDSATPQGFLDKDYSMDELKQVLNHLGNGKAAGWDEVPNEALKNAPDIFIAQLLMLYNRVKNTGMIPLTWKRGRLVLIHKKGLLVDIYNYRPLTVLTAMSGTYTKLMTNRLVKVVEELGLLGEIQNGFRRGRSGADCCFVINTVLWKMVGLNKPVHMAFLDLKKAYDSVDRPTLWRKLAKFGIGGKFLKSLQAMYEGDHVITDVNGVTTRPVYLGRGLRQGCSLSPLLFALYIAEMGQELTMTNQGVRLYKVTVNAMFFADDIVLMARTSDGLRELLAVVQRHCVDLKMTMSQEKSKVMSKLRDLWDLWEGDELVGSIDKVQQFRYLGVESMLSPSKGAGAMQKRALSLANRYKFACLRIGRDGPDQVEVSLCTWLNIAVPSILFGCESTTFTNTCIAQLDRCQAAVGKDVLGLPVCAPNVSVQALLGLRTVREALFRAQLKFFLKLQGQDNTRWCKDAFLAHLYGSWDSPYLRMIDSIKREVGMMRGPETARHVDIVVGAYFHQVMNDEIVRLNLPALHQRNEKKKSVHVNEGKASQVRGGIHICYFTYL